MAKRARRKKPHGGQKCVPVKSVRAAEQKLKRKGYRACGTDPSGGMRFYCNKSGATKQLRWQGSGDYPVGRLFICNEPAWMRG